MNLVPHEHMEFHDRSPVRSGCQKWPRGRCMWAALFVLFWKDHWSSDIFNEIIWITFGI